ncbi:RHS repeat protein [uncultured Winogradskyella sp.]|uniref:RHS repeat protein n=1 Tax=uncultured Winogradskyella sp. TaxID=395353 RepID=UPI00260A1697|nr:RHS repeat domain-containing protein [uncultured Winogradskyella sp.]
MKTLLNRFMQLLLCIFTISLNAQELPEVIPPSPTVANLMQFEEIPVSYYTGQPNISIPFYSKAISGDLAVNVSLSYNTQGVKVNNRSGWTGTGWSLNAGGVISRTVRGEPDEITKNNSATNKTGIYHLDDYWNYNDPSTDKPHFNYHVIGSPADKFDNKPDLYQFNFMNYSGRFVILKQGSTLVPKFITKNSNIKIEFVHTTDYKITSFKVTDPKGYVYTFDEIEASTTTPFTGSVSQGLGNTHNVSASQASQAHTVNTAWHLSKIENSSGIDLLSVTYTTELENYVASVSRSTNRILTAVGGGLNAILANSYNQGILEPAESVSYQNISSATKKLSEITFLQDNTKVVFNVDQSYTHPETNGKTLESIEIKNGTQLNKTFSFTYEETTDTSQSPNIVKRLWLTKVTETAGSINQDYTLSYTNKQNLPGFNTDFIYSDDWGYYSGINLDLFSCSNQTYDDDLIKTGLLSSIEYPTGGVKEFEFEHNTYSYYQSQVIPYNDYIQNPRNRTQESIFVDDLVYTNGSSPLELTISTFTLDFIQDIYISSWATASPSQYIDEHIIKIYDSSNQYLVNLNEDCATLTNVPAGTYTMALVPKENLLLDSYTITGDYSILYTDAAGSIDQEMIGGGVRIKEIRFKDNPLASTNEKKIKFSYMADDTNPLSSGVLDSPKDKLKRSYFSNKPRYLFGSEYNACGSFQSMTIGYQVEEFSQNIELTQGSYVGYRHVKVHEENNGYKTYSYTSPFEYPTNPISFEYFHPLPKENLDYKRGLLLEEKTFNQSGDILKEVSYKDVSNNPNYEFSEDFLFEDMNAPVVNSDYKQFYTLYDFYLTGTVENHAPSVTGGVCTPVSYPPMPFSVLPLTEDFNSGWAKLKGTTTKEYFYDAIGTQSLKETRQVFTYNDDNYQIKTQNTYYKVKGVDEHLETKYYYPVGITLGSNSGTIKNKLIASNKVTEVLETQSFRNSVQISETHNIYDDYDTSSNDLMLPKEVKVGKGTLSPEKRIEFLKYDNYANPTEVKKTDGTSIIYLYGFNGAVPVAKITNGNYSTVSSTLGGNTTLSGNLTTTQENSLRAALPNAMLSFYRYDPLIGVISTVDDKGYTTTYEYDAFNRLVRVKDAQGNILGENTYHYKNQ